MNIEDRAAPAAVTADGAGERRIRPNNPDAAGETSPKREETLPAKDASVPAVRASDALAKKIVVALEGQKISLNRTSAENLISYARDAYIFEAANNTANLEDAKIRLLILYDLYIKARSYIFINKPMFVVSVVLSVLVVGSPAAPAIFKFLSVTFDLSNLPKGQATGTDQTIFAGAAALAYALYSQYKDSQTKVENLMRQVLHAKKPDVIVDKIGAGLEAIDGGFNFPSLGGSLSGLFKKKETTQQQ